MNQNPYDFIKAFEGLNALDEPKAVVVLQNQTYTMSLEEGQPATPKIHDQAASVYAVVKFAIHNGLLSTTLLFEDFDDEDYLRFKSLCTNMTLDAWKTGEASDGLEHHLVLTLTDKFSHDYFMSCFLLTYAFDGLKPAATFVCRLEDAVMYQLPDQIKNQIVDKLDQQMATEDDSEDRDLELV